jgi:hypothetical protein
MFVSDANLIAQMQVSRLSVVIVPSIASSPCRKGPLVITQNDIARLNEYDVYDTDGAGTGTYNGGDGDAMTRSEERLVTDTRTEEAGKARLRKYVVTERQEVTVPVQHDEVRLQRARRRPAAPGTP